MNRTTHGDTIGWFVRGYLHMKAEESERKTVAEINHIFPPTHVFRIRIKNRRGPRVSKQDGNGEERTRAFKCTDPSEVKF